MVEDRKDLYERVTNRIIADLEKGAAPWQKPWSGDNVPTRPLRHNGQPYNGINVLVLWSEAMDKGFMSPKWMTFQQGLGLKGHVRKGEHGTQIVYANKLTKQDHNEETGADEEHVIPYLKAYTVFNADQIEGLPEHYYAKPDPRWTPKERIERAEEFFKNTGADIRIGGGRASYSVEPDYIQLPPLDAFKDSDSYYKTCLHELGHWTRHEKRLGRNLGRKQWGDEGYAKEELVAELVSAFASADLELAGDNDHEHAAYIASWLKALKDDKKFIFHAASHAQKACDYLHSLQPGKLSAAGEEPEEMPSHVEQVIASRSGHTRSR